MFLFLPLLVWSYSSNKKWGSILIAWIVKLGVIIAFIQPYINSVKAYILPQLYPYNTASLDDLETYLQFAYFYTYTRVGTYYLGALFGCYYFTHRKEENEG